MNTGEVARKIATTLKLNGDVFHAVDMLPDDNGVIGVMVDGEEYFIEVHSS